MRLSKTAVVGRRQDLVQRLLYFLTYFIRCSELQETHLLESGEDEAIVMPGTVITTTLEKGEVEESEYVLVTVHKNRINLSLSETEEARTSDCSCKYCNCPLSPGQNAEDASAQERDDPLETPEEETASAENRAVPTDFQESAADVKQCKEMAASCFDIKLEKVVFTGSTPVDTCKLAGPRLEPMVGSWKKEESLDSDNEPAEIRELANSVVEKKPPDKISSDAIPCSTAEAQTKVTFLIGDSMSPDSDIEVRSQAVAEQMAGHNNQRETEEGGTADQTREASRPLEDQNGDCHSSEAFPRVTTKLQSWNPYKEESVSLLDEYFTEENFIETRTIDDIPLKPTAGVLDPSRSLEILRKLCAKDHKPSSEFCKFMESARQGTCKNCFAEQDQRDKISICIPHGDRENAEKKADPGVDWDIPRNESSDSALGDSESEEAVHDAARTNNSYYAAEQEEWAEEEEIPFPGYVGKLALGQMNFLLYIPIKWCLF